MKKWMDGWKKWMDGRNGWMEERTEGWMDKWMEERMGEGFLYFNNCSCLIRELKTNKMSMVNLWQWMKIVNCD